MKPYNFTQVLRSPKGHMILIDPDSLYGYFEHPDGSEGGGLWFGHGSEALHLIDYDGTYELHPAIVETLRAAVYFLDESFD